MHFYIADINDNAPLFSQNPFNFFVREDANIGEFVGHFVATDEDNHGNDRVRYQLINAPSAIFALDTISGVLTLSGKLDHEDRAFYEFEVRAYDVGGLESKATVFVFVEDINDTPPQFEDVEVSASILEDAELGSLVCTLKFSDADVGMLL